MGSREKVDMKGTRKLKSGTCAQLALASLFAVAVAGSTFAASDRADVFYDGSGRKFPIWVSAKHAISASGIKKSYFSEADRNQIEDQIRFYSELLGTARSKGLSQGQILSTDEHCGVSLLTLDGAMNESVDDSLSTSFGVALKRSKAAILGSVDRVTTGFYRGRPALLLSLSVDEHLSESELYTPAFDVSLVVPTARFVHRDVVFCGSKGDSLALIPKVGDRYLLLPALAPPDRFGEVVVARSGELFMIGEENSVVSVYEPDLRLPTVAEIKSSLSHRDETDARKKSDHPGLEQE